MFAFYSLFLRFFFYKQALTQDGTASENSGALEWGLLALLASTKFSFSITSTLCIFYILLVLHIHANLFFFFFPPFFFLFNFWFLILLSLYLFFIIYLFFFPLIFWDRFSTFRKNPLDCLVEVIISNKLKANYYCFYIKKKFYNTKEVPWLCIQMRIRFNKDMIQYWIPSFYINALYWSFFQTQKLFTIQW